MRSGFYFLLITCFIIIGVSFTNAEQDLRSIYSRPGSEWPAPHIDKNISWQELGPLPQSPWMKNYDSLKNIIKLGGILFFDTRLSGSGKISCGTCHQPELSWTDGRERSLGHEGQVNKRNAPSIQNVWFYNKLFWDGRSHSLEDQAFAPINSESEMHSDMRELPGQLKKVKAYEPLFMAAFGSAEVNPDRIAEALAFFQRSISSRPSRFDSFLLGNKNALTNAEINGLHLFRTKARCINCHNGPMFSDNSFHNNGFAGADKGLYQVTHKDEDIGKLKTPSLRDVSFTGPWMHNGQFTSLESILDIYNKGKSTPNKDQILRKLRLSAREKQDLLAFLKAISAPPLKFDKPSTPGL